MSSTQEIIGFITDDEAEALGIQFINPADLHVSDYQLEKLSDQFVAQ